MNFVAWQVSPLQSENALRNSNSASLGYRGSVSAQGARRATFWATFGS